MLELEGLCKTFGATVALDHMSFMVPEGQVFGFLGPNGSGKTTTLRAIVGLLRLDSGSISLDGRPISELGRNEIGYMPEERGLYPKMTPKEQLVYLGRLAGMSAKRANGVAELWLSRFELQDRRSVKIETLSLGNQQRIQVIAALMHDPLLVLLDEPFSGLDPLAMEMVKELLFEKAREGAHVVFSSHQLDLVESICESMAIISHGKTVASGTLEELTRSSSQVYGVRIRGDSSGSWSSKIDGIRVLSNDAGMVRIELNGEVTKNQLLSQLISLGDLDYFALERRKVSEVFLEAMCEGEPAI